LELFLRNLHARHLLRLGRLHMRCTLHLLSRLITGIWAVLVRLLPLFGGLCQDFPASSCQGIGTEGMIGGLYSRFRCGWACRVIGCQRRWRSCLATGEQAQGDQQYGISIHSLSFWIGNRWFGQRMMIMKRQGRIGCDWRIKGKHSIYQSRPARKLELYESSTRPSVKKIFYREPDLYQPSGGFLGLRSG
jgi:hypothetical protein